MNISINTKDEIIMRLVHYFVTVENYQPIIVNGVRNEIWLENLNAPYRIVRINSNYIHNNDQLEFDSYKLSNVVKQIKRKTFSLKLKTLNILLDVNQDVEIEAKKNIDTFEISSIKDVRKNEGLAGLYPKLKTFTLHKGDNLDLIVNITNDINNKTEEENKSYEKVFKAKPIILTRIIMAICIIVFLLIPVNTEFWHTLALNPNAVRAGEYWRLITAAFLHANIIHLFVNMYALHILGTQVETFLGRWKFLLIYLISAITGSLLSVTITNHLSVGASGAIFGLLGALAYFGYHYRLYLGDALRGQIIPVIIINLAIGFAIPYIDNAAHIGGLIGGAFIAMAVGIGRKEDKLSRINGVIISIIYLAFLIYLLLN